MRVDEAWRILGLPTAPSARAIKRAFRQLAKSTHPDVIGGGGATASRFARITEAYEVALREATAAGRIAATERDLPRTRPAPPPRRRTAPSTSTTAGEAPSRAHPGSTTYDGATDEVPVWDGAAWVGADSGTYWTVNPREYADPRKHGPEYRARGRRPVRRTPRERSPEPAATPAPIERDRGAVRPRPLLLAGATLLAVVLLGEGALRLAAGAVLSAILAFAALSGRHR